MAECGTQSYKNYLLIEKDVV